ncbi:MAG: hypothetical protein WC140_06575 [Bacteroidales bacterium]
MINSNRHIIQLSSHEIYNVYGGKISISYLIGRMLGRWYKYLMKDLISQEQEADKLKG